VRFLISSNAQNLSFLLERARCMVEASLNQCCGYVALFSRPKYLWKRTIWLLTLCDILGTTNVTPTTYFVRPRFIALPQNFRDPTTTPGGKFILGLAMDTKSLQIFVKTKSVIRSAHHANVRRLTGETTAGFTCQVDSTG
jgi:hypothetical protein